MTDQLEFRIDGKLFATPCLEVLVIVRSNLAGGAAQYLRLHDAYVAKFRSRITFIRLSSSKRSSKIKPRDFELLSAWAGDQAFQNQQTFLGFRYQSGSSAESVDVPQFEYLQAQHLKPSPMGAIRITLPHSPLPEAVATARSFVEQLSGPAFMWGSIGWSFSWPSGSYESRDIREWMTPKLKRHPGFSTGVLSNYLAWSSFGVPHVGWTTLLGREMVEPLGGSQALQKRATEENVTFAPIAEGGAMLQAGPQPDPGDVNRGDRLPLQRAVGRLIDPVKISDEGVAKVVYIDGFELEDARSWVTRFFRDPPSS